ncbi:DHS-like NAD/FAD-binding domain-containing protein [Cryphonectria parasitica EP155]|uniref:protein acetyllysine N-acetyltransferase n=1 Tax=Cryphonectria parasitica (strain ATCC 38755 / EP155) TaxID=660469 RepID=A0A9P4YBA7_CRYP1|nr:DHS-like NAD/FAD-binding domain-containing protein [Cryphonectria parasitica EP155]KAF3769752.1 DHS-like NAD/FAD-binding domain-containing protein [Cryphonectria parasitica EP155]
MATTAPKIAEQEHQEESDVVDRKAADLAERIRRSKHFIVFTGAGVSTSAGIADFRGPEGVWTLMAQGRESSIRSIDTVQALPTPAHMALVELQDRGMMKYLVSQNCDGLHRKSGISPDRISELHGNSNREYCKECGKEYIRDFRAVAPDHNHVNDHRTGRKCALCKGVLLDSIINFGEYLPETPLKEARKHAKKADLCLVLGSSLRVPPACEIPETVGRSKTAALVICNLQNTPMDELADVRIHAKADDLMERVMRKLECPIPTFVLRRRLVVAGSLDAGGRLQVKVSGVDVDGTPMSFLRSVRCTNNRRLVRSEPFIIHFRGASDPSEDIKLDLEFMGHYGEPNLGITYRYEGEDRKETVYDLEYNPMSRTWVINVNNLAG